MAQRVRKAENHQQRGYKESERGVSLSKNAKGIAVRASREPRGIAVEFEQDNWIRGKNWKHHQEEVEL